MNDVFLNSNNPEGYSDEDRGVIINNLGGLLQILIVRLEGKLE